MSASQDGNSPKRRRLVYSPNSSLTGPDAIDDSLKTKLHAFWKLLWIDKENPFCEVAVRRDSDPVDGVDIPATIRVLRLDKIFSPIGDIMVRDDYDKAMKDIEDHYTSGEKKSVIIAGHPGIGKTTLLYYILVKRLLDKKPTILQNSTQYLIFFHTNGVTFLHPRRSVDPELEEYRKTWALVDINLHVETPAEALGNPFFLVMASSPRASRLRKLRKYRRPAAYWLMKPFTLAELIQARHLQRFLRKESDIKNFFDKYGPSARDCYDFCKAGAVDEYHVEVHSKVNEMSWDLITQILTCRLAVIKAEEGYHKVLVIEPQPDNRAFSRARIASQTVSQLLWERDSGEQWRNHRKLFKTLLREAIARPSCEKILESAFHDLCIRGARFTIYPMECRAGRVNHTFTNTNGHSASASKDLQLKPERVFFFDDEKDPITSLAANYYYRPTSSVYPSLDSFVYDPDFHQITAFHVTLAETHDFVEKGANAFYELGRRLQIDNLKIRIIMVVFEDAEVNLMVRKEVIHSLGLEPYTLTMTEHQLYSQHSDS